MNKTVLTSFTILCLSSTMFLMGLVFNVQPAKAETLQLELATDKDVYALGENVTITLLNKGNETVEIGGYPAWEIFTYPEEEPVYPENFAYLAWSLDPGENDTLTWNQFNEFKQSYVEPGTYVIRDTQGWGLTTYFKIVAAEIMIPDDYPTIQTGINSASLGDTIFVRNGTYYEHVVVNKTLFLIGENRGNTVIDGSNIGKVVRVTANDTEIRGFTIQKAGFTPWGSDSGIYVKSSNNVITDNIIVDNDDWAIWLDSSSSNNTITFNTITNNWRGCMLKDTSGNTLVENNITDHGQDGICLWNSSQNAITDNNISDNVYGVALTSSHTNNLTRNNIANNLYGVSVDSSSSNEFYHNNFIHNDQQAYFFTLGGTNSWDNGVEGNYWSNYTGDDLDPDGIGDTEHVIDTNNTDYYPLMGMFSSFNTSLGKHVNVVSNSTIESFEYFQSEKKIRMHVSNMTGNQTFGFCRICIPRALMNETYRVFVNATEILPAPLPLPCSNSTHNYIYFNYTHSTEEIVIVPEFPSFLIMPLFMIATLLAVIVYKRKHVDN